MDNSTVSITLLMDDVSSDGYQSEHGLSLWIVYRGRRILFDTGQSDALLYNAEKRGIDISRAEAVVLSHGHYDHTGGLAAILDRATETKIYLHPAAIESKYSKKALGVNQIGMSDSAKQAIKGRRVIWTATPAPLFPGISVTGQVPRCHEFEESGKWFYLDEDCKTHDLLLDDQALLIESPRGLIVVFGCAHAGVVNTLDCITKLTGGKEIYALMGGMHLLNASQKRIVETIKVLKEYQVKFVIPLHCTGREAMDCLKDAFNERCLSLLLGGQIYF